MSHPQGSPSNPYCCSSLYKAWIIFSYAGACTVWRLYCAQPLYEAQQRSNKSLSLLPFLHVTSRSPSLLQAPSSCLWKAKAFLVIDTWLATFLGRGSLSWRRALCMSHRCLSARYTCTAASSSSPPKPFFSFNQPSRFWPTVPATGVLLQGSIIRQFPGELLMACRGPDK